MNRKPKRPNLQVTGVATLNDHLRKISTTNHSMEGGSCPVVEIDKVIELLKDFKEKYKSKNPVIVSSKRSLYIGHLNLKQYEEECERYEQEMTEYKAKKKASLLKQLKELDEE